jgi:Reverse transcriptase (RNA-dependent DNA polymerase)
MIQSKDLEERLQELGWTLYRLAKEFAQMRTEGGVVHPVTRYHGSIGKAIENPGKSKLETIEDIVKALDGELTIVWEPDKVVTVPLDDELMEALNEKAKEIGTTASEVAEQLLRQALQTSSASGERQSQTKTRKLQSSLASKREPQPLKFHPYIAEAYTAVHEWLATRPEAAGYKELDYSVDLERSLDHQDLQSAAFQYYALFPKNYFRTIYTLNNVIGIPKLLSWLKCNSRICIVDIGCATGAASAAFVEIILALQEIEILQNVEIFCLGVEPNIYGITLYSKLMQEIQNKVKSSGVKFEFQVLCESLPKATIPIIKYLQKKRALWDKQLPLSHVLLMQLDIISPFNQFQTAKREQYEKLKELGIDPTIIVEDDEPLGQYEALAYKQILEEVQIDYLHLMTIGTENIENRLLKTSESKSLIKDIQRIMKEIRQSFSGIHRVDEDREEVKETVCVEYPMGSYWKDRIITPENLKLYAQFYTVANANLIRDSDWNNVINFNTLELAWVQARRNLLNAESFYDEVEINIFEKNLTKNLNLLRNKLITYHQEVIPNGDEINHNTPKGLSRSRPKVLSRLEEELLQTALVQVLGKRGLFNSETHSYAYHLSNTSDETEYLYEHWFTAYRKFINSARQAANQHKDGVVIRTDIKSYYQNIIQEDLLEITDKELDIRSDRIRWLLRKLLNKPIQNHEFGHGLSQGLLASGFYANIYLIPVDERFNSDNRWNVKYYRYVDDIILIVPNPADKDNVLKLLKHELKKLGLELNVNKTEIYENVSKFIEIIRENTRLEKLSYDFDRVINPLWIMNHDYRSIFDNAYRNNDWWWSLIKRYWQCLRSINIYITEPDLSRRIYKYLFNECRREKDLKREYELKLPNFPGYLPDTSNFLEGDSFKLIENWEISFIHSQLEWLEDKKALRSELINLFQESWRELQQVTPLSYSRERELQRHIRFAVNKLSLLGFKGIAEEIEEILCNRPAIVGEPLHLILNLASQGDPNAIRRMGEHYRSTNSSETSEYMRAVILQAMRYLPDFNEGDWKLLVESATVSDSVVEKLKATETWLFLDDVSDRFVKEDHINAVVKALNSAPPPQTRLQKNYVLILGRHKPEAIPELNTSDSDYLLRDAIDIAQEEEISYLFEEEEPSVIRQYYSGQRPANMHEERST